MIKVSILFGWFACGVLLPQYMQHLVQAQTRGDGIVPPWYTAYTFWDPTNSTTGLILMDQFFHRLGPTLRNATLSNQAFLQHVVPVVRQMPDLRPLAGPHLAWAALGVAAVMVAALAFRRFGNALS